MSKKGVTILFTGLSGAGKTTVAEALCAKIKEYTKCYVTLLDGDIVRQILSAGLGFSREDREMNVQRVGFVAAEIARHGGLVICALIAPYSSSRYKVRNMASANGNYVEVFVSTPVNICEKRDPKGLYAKARQGLIKNFTGIDDPYEIPEEPEISIDTSEMTVDEAVNKVMEFLLENEYIDRH